MSVSIDTVRQGFESLQVKVQELKPTMLGVGIKCENTSLKIVISLEEEGEYLRMRTVGYAKCPEDHPAFEEVMECVAKMNYDLRLVCVGWDRDDGEISAEVMLPIEDNPTLTSLQVGSLFTFLCKGCDDRYPELARLLGKTAPAQSPAGREPAKAMSRPETAPGGGAGKALQFGVLLLGLSGLGFVLWLFTH